MTDKAKLEKIKKLADAMYYAAFNLTTDASLLRKAMDDYHQFIINEYHKEESVSGNIDFEKELYKAFGQVKDFTICMQIAKRFFKVGAQWQKEQMIKDSVNATIDHPFQKFEYPNLFPDYRELKDFAKSHKLKDKDKVKVIIIKENKDE